MDIKYIKSQLLYIIKYLCCKLKYKVNLHISGDTMVFLREIFLREKKSPETINQAVSN